MDLLESLRRDLATSTARQRKAWARQILTADLPLERLMFLLHAETRTAQRFTWLLGDICQMAPNQFRPCLGVLFELRDAMPFSGMQRSVAKWLWLTNVPIELESDAIDQLFAWLEQPAACIASKSYSAKALDQLARQGRIEVPRLKRVLEDQAQHSNRAYAGRIRKILDQWTGS